jgi:hypothetical protein
VSVFGEDRSGANDPTGEVELCGKCQKIRSLPVLRKRRDKEREERAMGNKEEQRVFVFSWRWVGYRLKL